MRVGLWITPRFQNYRCVLEEVERLDPRKDQLILMGDSVGERAAAYHAWDLGIAVNGLIRLCTYSARRRRSYIYLSTMLKYCDKMIVFSLGSRIAKMAELYRMALTTKKPIIIVYVDGSRQLVHE